MALNLDAVGQKIGPVTKTYSWKDAVLYALGVGAGFSELEYCYENGLKVLPSFAITTLYDFMPALAAASNVNLAGILHGEQELIFHNPIPPEGNLTTVGRITHYYDKGPQKGALVLAESVTQHENGQKLFTGLTTLFSRLDGGFDGPDAPRSEVVFPDRQPDAVVSGRPSENQPLLFRLSGDVFALHVDEAFAKRAGFERPIMHGLCTHGFACLALINQLVPGAPERVRRLACRFTRPLYPGSPIETRIWKVAEGKALWQVVNADSGEVVIDRGEFEFGREAVAERIDFDGQAAIVTGAGGGLGRVYALELARRGARVVVNDWGGARDGRGKGSSAPAEEVVKEIEAFGGKAVVNDDNVALPEGGEAIVAAALAAFGRVDILINNAGILRDKSFAKMSPEEWQAVLDVHLSGAYNVSRPAFAVMKEQGYGRILMTTSAAGLYGNFGQTNYGAAKMGVVGLMNTLKIEGMKHDIKVNAVAPIAASRLTEDVMPGELFEKMAPEAVAPLVVFLSSSACPVSGHIYNVAAGFINRAAVITGSGMVVGSAQTPPSVEAVADRIEEIGSVAGGKEYWEAITQIGDAAAALSAPAGKQEQGRTGPGSVAAVFAAMPGAFVADAAGGVEVVFQFDISGTGGGRWHCIVKDKTCTVAKGTHDRPVCTVKMAADDFLSMMAGALPAMQAYTTGKLKIEGDLMKSQLIEKLFAF